MQSEEFDKRIVDAAEHHYPAYNEKAWPKMERLLDTHMPQEDKNRRRGILFLLLFLLLSGGVTWYFLTQPEDDSESPIVKTGSSAVSHGSAESTDKPAAQSEVTSPLTGKENSGENSTGPEGSSVPGGPITLNNNNDQGSAGRLEINSKNPASRKKSIVQTGVRLESSNQKSAFQEDPILFNDKSGIPEKPGNPFITQTEAKKQTELLPAKPTEEKSSEITNVEKLEETLQPTTKTADAEKPRAKKQNSLSISLSAGPDISGVGYNFGKVQPVYGFGLGYTFKDRFTVRAGLYVASKIYTASPKEYKPDYPIPNFNYLQKIDADCRVFEIPIIVSYNFPSGKKHHWFAAAGLSSYLMKKETYDYYYKYPGGTTYIHRREVNNENNHIFSGASLSGGYTRQINNTFSLTAEPYVKLPLNGIGAGDIRLQSAGLLISVNAKLTGNKK